LAEALGRHILCEVYDCDRHTLCSLTDIRTVMVDAAKKAGAEVLEVVFHEFSPQGVSGVVVISESHLAIHTWPEYGYAAVDVFTCGDRVDPWVACDYLVDYFKPRYVTANEVRRGIFHEFHPSHGP